MATRKEKRETCLKDLEALLGDIEQKMKDPALSDDDRTKIAQKAMRIVKMYAQVKKKADAPSNPPGPNKKKPNVIGPGAPVKRATAKRPTKR